MVEYLYDTPSRDPKESPHWLGLEHKEGDCCLESLPELKRALSSDLEHGSLASRLALWSCLLGYCEALSTHKQTRYSLYPIPIEALERLVKEEFRPPTADSHRSAAQAVSNWIWQKVVSKSSVKDELHANSLYTTLRGKIDGKSVDCFGAALVTVIGLRQLGYVDSILTLSEDHAYESHPPENVHSEKLSTCEVARPGNTKTQKAKRGQEVAETFDKKKSQLTPETSWLYMATAPVYCRTPPMILAAALANLNCLIESKQNKMELNSKDLLLVKRELLWILKDGGHLDEFPFALCELGWSEEHCTSSRGEKMVSVPDLAPVPVTAIEWLYHEAIVCSQQKFHDRQVYTYCYMGYFHKDGGQEEEYRFAVALKYFYHAARVASQYTHEWGDTLQLTKVMTKISEFVVYEICCNGDGKARKWNDPVNAVAATRWLLAFFDALLVWEERTTNRFLPILQSNHKTGIVKVFSLIEPSVRVSAFESKNHNDNEVPALQSARLLGSLGDALRKHKVSISDLQLTLISDSRARRKRKQQG